MPVQIVHVTSDNRHVLDHVAEDVFDADIDADRLSAYLARPEHIMVVAVLDGLVVGQARAVLHHHPDIESECYVDNLGVSPAHQRQGIATQLMNVLIALGQAHGCTEIWLGTEADNQQAVGFYRAYGLIESPVVMFANFEEDEDGAKVK